MSFRELFHKASKYADTKANMTFDEHADERVLLEEAIRAAEEQAKTIEARCADVVAQQKVAQMRLSRVVGDVARLEASAKTAATQAQSATAAGNTAQAEQYTNAARSFAMQLVSTREQQASATALVESTTAAAQEAKLRAQENQELLREKMAEHDQLLAKLGQTRMAQALASSMDSLNNAASHDVPSLDQVRDRIDTEYAQAQARTEVGSASDAVAALDTHHAELVSAADAELAKLMATPQPQALNSSG